MNFFDRPRFLHCKFSNLSILKIMLAIIPTQLCCDTSLHLICFLGVIMKLLSIYSFVKHSGGTVSNDTDYIAIGHCIQNDSNFTENFNK